MPANISLYCVPIAWLLALAPRGYSILTFNKHPKNLHKIDGAHLRTPRSFKDLVAADASIPQLYRERIIRAECASLNGLENLGFFAAAVGTGNAVVALGRDGMLDAWLLNRIAVAYVVSKALYNVVFVRNDTNRFVFVRTGVFMVGTAINSPSFNITAISAKNNASRFECWQLAAEPNFNRAAVNFDLGEFADSFVGMIPPKTSTGTLSNAQAVQYSLVMGGLVHIRTPHSGLPDELNGVWIEGGRYGWLIAADTVDVAAQGHITEFPGDEKTVIAQFPIKCNEPPAHAVLHDGPCLKEDYAGL